MATEILTQAQLTAVFIDLPGWTGDTNGLQRTYKFGSFKEAMSFMVRVGFEAEALNHHPEWTNIYNQVAITLRTHDADNCVTAKDVALARKIQAIAWVE